MEDQEEIRKWIEEARESGNWTPLAIILLVFGFDKLSEEGN